MKIKTQLVRNIMKFFEKNEENCMLPITLIGVKCDFEDHFIPWLFEECKKEGIVISDKSDAIDTAFIALMTKKQVKSKISWFESSILLFEGDDICLVGVELENANDANSIKRVKIDIREDLEKIGLMHDTEDPNIVDIIQDIVILEY